MVSPSNLVTNSSMSDAVQNASNSNTEIHDFLTSMQTWTATLPFPDIEGFDEPVDLFQYTSTEYKPGYMSEATIVFDRVRYPPTDEGLEILMNALKGVAQTHGTNLITRRNPYELNCNRCRVFKSHRKGMLDVKDAADFDEDGVLVGIRSHSYHHNRRNNRSGGRSKCRGTSTSLPMTKETTCKVMLRIAKHVSGYFYLKTGLGCATHTFHTRTDAGNRLLFSRHCRPETKRLIESSQRASVGVPKTRYVTLEHTNDMVSESTARYLALRPSFLLNKRGGDTSAAEMIKWLRSKALDQQDPIAYCCLSHTKNSVGDRFFSNPKGRPRKRNPTMTLPQVREAMTYNDVLDGCFETVSRVLPNEFCPTFSPINEDDCDDDKLDLEGDTSELRRIANLTRSTLDEKHTKALKVLLGAAWVSPDGWQQFHRFPEVIFSDTTFKSCNEARPMFLLVGRDSNGNGFVITRIYMSNETGPFFLWIFHRSLPTLLGTSCLKKVNFMLTDGDSQEYNSIDSSRGQFFTNARRGRCCRHLIHNTFEDVVGSPDSCVDKDVALKYFSMIKHWVYSWCNGKSCGTEDEFQFSKDMLFHELDTNAKLRAGIGESHVGIIREWLIKKIMPHIDKIAFYPRHSIRHFDEYMTNVVEGMNYAAKKADISAKPNKSMKNSAKSMEDHAKMKSMDRKHELGGVLSSVPLYLKPDGPHNIECLSAHVNVARHLLINQYNSEFIGVQNVFCLVID